MSIHDKWSSEKASDWVVTPSEVKLQPVKKAEETKKSMEDSRAVLFIGLKISGADKLAIDGGEKPEDFHVTLAYGHFDTNGHDEDDTSVRVQHAIDDIRDLIPDSIHFDAMGRFKASESSDGKDVIYAQVAAGQLEKVHDGLLEALKKRGIKLEGTFPTYKPHMTLAYIEAGSEYELKQIDASGTATKVMIGHGWESTKEHNYTITKMDDDKRLVFGWASISLTAEGEQLEDLQHDLINPEDLEEAVYEYVLNFRDTGEEHRPHLRKKGKLVESCVFTAEKQKAMGLPEGILPVGWWIGFKIEDDEAWEKVKNGTYRMFSIEGKAQRIPVEKAAPEEVEKFNPYHDERGRFTTANGSGQAGGIGSLKPIKPNPKWAYQPDDETDLDDMVENPIPFVGVGKDMELAIKFEDETIQSGYVSNAKVNISDLQTLQPFVLRSGIENYQRWDETDKPYVVEYESKYYVLDGNHRIAQAMLSGEKTVTVDLSKRKLRVSKSISAPDRFDHIEEFDFP